MASFVDISNMALSHHGSDAIVSSIDPPDGSVEAGHCARFLPIARVELLESSTWSFATRRVALAEVTNPSPVWAYAYALPSDKVKPLRVFNSFELQNFGFLPTVGGWITPSELAYLSERGSADFTIEGGVLLTNEPEAVLLYVQDVTDPSKFTPTFTVALSYLLAAYLSGPLIKGSEGAKTAGEFRKIASGMALSAAALDANASAESAADIPQSIRARL